MCNKCNVLQSSRNHRLPSCMWKNHLPHNRSLVSGSLGTDAPEDSLVYLGTAGIWEIHRGALHMSLGLCSPTPEGKVVQESPDLLLQGHFLP